MGSLIGMALVYLAWVLVLVPCAIITSIYSIVRAAWGLVHGR